MTTRITGISSMATRLVLAELAGAWRGRSGVDVAFESVGGVDAARRVQAGECYDLAVLDADELAVLERALANPASRTHPGVLHMYIHLMEMSPTPELALRPGDFLRG